MADLERHIPMAERLDNDPGDAGRMARSFLAAMRENADLRARLASVRGYVDYPGNWSALDGRRRHLLALIDGEDDRG